METVSQHAVQHLGVPHALSPARAWHQIGGPVHVLHAAGNRSRGMTRRDLECRRCKRLCTRSAHPIHCQGGHLHGQSAADGSLSCRIHPSAGLDHVTHHNGVDGLRGQT